MFCSRSTFRCRYPCRWSAAPKGRSVPGLLSLFVGGTSIQAYNLGCAQREIVGRSRSEPPRHAHVQRAQVSYLAIASFPGSLTQLRYTITWEVILANRSMQGRGCPQDLFPFHPQGSSVCPSRASNTRHQTSRATMRCFALTSIWPKEVAAVVETSGQEIQ